MNAPVDTEFSTLIDDKTRLVVQKIIILVNKLVCNTRLLTVDF